MRLPRAGFTLLEIMVVVHGTSTHVRKARGFTLVELLVVLLVVGLLAGLISVIAQPDDRARLRSEAERLAERLDLAAIESRLTGQAFAWTAEASQYRFWRQGADADWTDPGEALSARGLPAGMALSGLRIEAMPAELMRLEFNPYNSVAYEIQMSLGEARFAVVGSPVGQVRVHDSR
jgi:general secretion pathway protein H